MIVLTDCPECDQLAMSGGVCSHCAWEAVQPNHSTGGVPGPYTATHRPHNEPQSVCPRPVAGRWLAEARRQIRDAAPASAIPSKPSQAKETKDE